ncbi:HIT family protein [Methanospirillum purgamenti]|nr:HIT family protein [Methanospirillum hungatei]
MVHLSPEHGITVPGTGTMLHSPDGYNIGINDGIPARKTVIHLHIHIIPRYSGDMVDPEGGVRGVIPEKQKY